MNGSCIQFSYQTFVLTLPVILSISPKNADTSELFPEPTVPTTATREPCLKLRLMFFRITCSLAPHENVPFSITRGSSEINNKILPFYYRQIFNFLAPSVYFILHILICKFRKKYSIMILTLHVVCQLDVIKNM